jgi:diacylglycerol O-acyltransferase / wax synthase
VPTPLTGLDASFLYLETRTAHMHVASAIVVDPSTAPDGTLTVGRMKDYISARLHLAPPFRRRLVTIPLRLDHPMWIEDPDFDLDYHVRRAALPAPGGMRELGEFMGDFMSRPLDRSRPLWEMWVVEGLEGGRVAICNKTHHAAIDGVSGAELLAAILQLSPDQEPPAPAAEWQPEREPHDLRLLAGAGVRIATRPWKAVGAARRLAESATGVVRQSRSAHSETPPAPFAAPMTMMNGAIGPHRRVAFAELPLAEAKAIKQRLSGTLNDVILTVVAGALRRHLHEHGEPTDQSLVGMVPISTHAAPESGDSGNQVSAMLVGLPVDVADPVERLARVATSTAGAKEQHGAVGATTIQQLVELAPAGVSSLAARAYTRAGGANRHRPIWNLIISNVPGPRIPLYCAGARLEAMYPIGPVHEMVGLNITLFSYADTIFVGMNGDRDLMPDLEDLGGALHESFDELLERAKDVEA